MESTFFLCYDIIFLIAEALLHVCLASGIGRGLLRESLEGRERVLRLHVHVGSANIYICETRPFIITQAPGPSKDGTGWAPPVDHQRTLCTFKTIHKI